MSSLIINDLQLEYIILRGDIEESLFSCGYNGEKSKDLYSAAKDRISRIAIISTCFKKYFHEIKNKRRHKEESFVLFFYLP